MKSSFSNLIPSATGRVLVWMMGLVNPGFRAAFKRLTWDRVRMQSYELKRMQDIVTWAYEHSPLYKKMYDDAGVKPADLKSLDDIKKFPILTKSILRQALANKTIFTSSVMPAGTVIEPTTGSTGNPVTLYLDHHAHHDRTLNGMRALWLMGAFPYKRFAFLWRKKSISRMQKIRSKLGLFKHFPVVDVQNATGSAIGKSDLGKIVDELVAFKPQIVRGYTSALWIIAQYVKKHNIEFKPECVITSAEYVPRLWQEEMGKIFGCPVHNLYGGTEAAPVAISLGYDSQLTVFSDFYYTEIVDDAGLPAPVATTGRILITDYGNKYMPLVRYEIGDMAAWSGQENGPFETFSEVQGRINDLFVLPGGKIVFSHNWHIYLRDLKSVSKFKVVQKALDRIEITLERAESNIDWNDELNQLKKTVENAFGESVSFVWDLVDSIPLDPGEKFRPVRSEIDSSIILKSVSNSFVEKLREYPLSSHKAWEIADKTNVLKLDWNEADVTIPESIKQPLREFIEHGQLTWYPDVSNRELVREIADYSNLPVECIQYFEGSDCGLDYIVRTFMAAGDEAVLAAPTYDNFRVYIESVGGIPRQVFGRDLFESDIASIKNAVTEKTKIIYIVNPNNPTGVMYSESDVEDLLRSFPDVMVIIDEAYMEFSGSTLAHLVSKYPNIIIARSFAKAFGLASFRIGYILSNEENIKHVNKIRNGKNVPALAQIAAIAALRNRGYMDDYVTDVRNARTFMCDELKQLGFDARETTGNFIIVKLLDALKFRDELLRKNVFVRALDHLPGMRDYIRITVVSMNGSKKFIEIVQELRTQGVI